MLVWPAKILFEKTSIHVVISFAVVFGLLVFFNPTSRPLVLKRESKTFLDSGFHGVDSGFQVPDPDTLSVELRFRILNSN